MDEKRLDIDAFSHPGDHAVAELANRQYGRVAHRQLIALGYDRGAIQYRVRSGRLHRVHHGVYAVGHTVVSPGSARIAAVLACGREAALSHQAAGAHWSLRASAAALIDVTVPGRGRRNRPGIRIHCVRHLDPRDVTVKGDIPVTTVARTLLDNAEVLRVRQLERMLEEAERLRLFDLTAVRDLIERSPGRRGIRPLIDCLARTQEVPPHDKSDLERLFLDLCRDEGFPQPVLNGYVEGYEVDAHWPGTKFIIELDSWSFHRTRVAFERDHERDLKLARYKVIRLTWRQLTRGRAEVVTTLRALLGSARTRPAPGPGARARALP